MKDEIDEALKDINFEDEDNFGHIELEISKKEEEKQGGAAMEVEDERLFGMNE